MAEFHNIIDDLKNKYKNDPFMKYKLESYIKNLPILMSNIEEQYKKKNRIKQQFIENKSIFINKFLNENLFFYIPQTELFIHYDYDKYQHISEDNILHLIIKTINNYEPDLQHSKFKIQSSIIKIIKEYIGIV